MVATLDSLDEDILIEILTKPKNALVKQFEYLLSLDDVKLSFDDEALRAIAKKALQRKTGARGLRSIMEGILKDVMYEVPSQSGVTNCHITKAVVEDDVDPILSYGKKRKGNAKTNEVSA